MHIKKNYFIFGFCSLLLASCAHQDAKNLKTEQNKSTHPTDEYSLKADRQALEEQRREIPEEVKRNNDEVALVLQLMQTNDLGEMQEPSRIRDRFDKAVRDRRDKIDKESRKSRDEYSKNERLNRETYFNDLKKQRDEFMKSKHDNEARNRFFSEQDEKRRDFIATQQEKRNDFESDIREKRKNFDDYIHEKQEFFNQEARSYAKRYDEMRKAQSLKKDMQEKERRIKESQAKSAPQAPLNPTTQQDLEDLKNFPRGSAQPIGADE